MIPDELYRETARRLCNAIDAGLGAASFNYEDSRNILKSYLTRNVYHFSAAKSLTEMLEFRNLMYDKNSKEMVPFSVFKQRLTERGKLFNDVWLKTEYDTAFHSAVMAHRWDSMQAEYLEYRTVGDDRVRPAHAELDRLTYPKDHPIWNKMLPPLGYNCRCTVIPGIADRYNAANADTDERFVGGLVKGTIFDNNVGKTRLVFDHDHPYYVNLPDRVAKELNYKNYGLESIDRILETRKLPPAAQLENIEGYKLLWERLANNPKGITLTDPLGQTVLFPDYERTGKGRERDYFKQHLLTRGDKNRYKLFPNLIEIIRHPDEIWSIYKPKDSEPLTTHYLKYYREQPVLVIVVDNEGRTMFDLTKSGYKTRQGLLLYRKTKKPR